MMTHGSVAKKARLDKERHPEDYCVNPTCLWRVVTKTGPPRPCPKHTPSSFRKEGK